ncbi:hypothetical protein E3E26_07525 [Thermococcus sp. LS1]|uniref:hypothetical protein n=1 Tax=Thermococcus sp. LS1 TaxID=1638259 RepID=UPI00143B1267|nr:hypothetical protein [Thermococcus sp. LS1]NJD99632.1 hypothetical protein [Thermococcus sp. LS1]
MVAHYPLLHTILTIAMAYHTGTHNPEAAKPIEKVLNASYTLKEDYSTIKKKYTQLARAIAHHAREQGLITDEEKTAKVMEQAFEKTFKIVDKLLPELPKLTEERAKIAEKALEYSTDDPFVVLRNAGIDIEPELEEFRQFLAEISGKKVEPGKPKYPATKKAVEEELRKAGASENIKLEAQKLLGILSGLKFADYSEKAVEKALKELDAQIEKLLEGRNLKLLGVYSTVALLLRKGEFEKAEEFLKKLSADS